MDEQNVICRNTMGYYLVIKMNEVLLYAMTWMTLENTMVSKIIQTQKDKYHVILLI